MKLAIKLQLNFLQILTMRPYPTSLPDMTFMPNYIYAYP